MKLESWSLVLMGLIISGACPVHATMMTIEPDDYAPGTNLSGAVEGVSLLSFSRFSDGSYSFAPVYAESHDACTGDPFNCSAVTGTNTFSPNASASSNDIYSGSYWGSTWDSVRCFQLVGRGLCTGMDVEDNFTDLLIAFDEPMSYVEISGVFYSDGIRLAAFDAGRNFLGSGTGWDNIYNCFPYNFPCTSEFNSATTWIQRPTADISYVLAGSALGTWTVLDVLRFSRDGRSVPAPGPLGLFLFGLAALALRRRRETA